MNKNQHRIEAVYQTIVNHINSKGIAPSHREIATHCAISVVAVNDFLRVLSLQGRIIHDPKIARGIQVVAENDIIPQDNGSAELVYDYLELCSAAGDCPSQTELALVCNMSRSEVRRNLLWLEINGKIERPTGKRNIRLTNPKLPPYPKSLSRTKRQPTIKVLRFKTKEDA